MTEKTLTSYVKMTYKNIFKKVREAEREKKAQTTLEKYLDSNFQNSVQEHLEESYRNVMLRRKQ